MKRVHVTILEEDEEYVQQLAFAIERREAGNLEVAWYTDLERYLEREPIEQGELLVLGEEFQEESIISRIQKEGNSPVIVMLSADGITREQCAYPVIEKYTSVDNIIRRLYLYASEGLGQDTYLPGEKNYVIGVYAPWNLELSMLFCEVLLQIVSEPVPALYVSLQECIGRKPEGEEILSDLICFLRRKSESATARIKSMSRELGKGRYLPPIENPLHLSELTPEDYEHLWRAVRSQQEYPTVIMEFGNAYRDMYADMKACGIVYCPYQDELLQEARRKQLEQRLEQCGESDLQFHFVRMPRLAQYNGLGESGRKSVQQELLCSSFGDTVRGLVEGYGS